LSNGGTGPLKADLSTVTRTLQNITVSSRSKAMLEAARAFNAIISDEFRTSLAEDAQSQVDRFAEALEKAAGFFTPSQRQRIVDMTGLTMSNDALNTEMAFDDNEEAGDENQGPASAMPEDDLDKQLRELKGEVDDRFKGISAAKRRRIEDSSTTRARPDWNGQAAPETPAAIAARAWAARRAGVRAPQPPATAPWQQPMAGRRAPPQRRSWGIASLDTSSRLHGKGAGGFAHGQLSQHADTEYFSEAKDGAQAPQGKQHIRLPKGLPTVAPMTPAPRRNAAEI